MQNFSENNKPRSKALLAISLGVSVLILLVVMGLINTWGFEPAPAGEVGLVVVNPKSFALTPPAPATPTPLPVSQLPPVLMPIKQASLILPAAVKVITVTAEADSLGWATDLDGRSHFNVPNIHAGTYRGHTYYGAMQFDLSALPANATISYAALEVNGLVDQSPEKFAALQLNLLDAEIDSGWSEVSFEALHNARVETGIPFDPDKSNLTPGGYAIFPFDQKARHILAQHMLDKVVSFRLDAPAADADGLFTWAGGSGQRAILHVGVTLLPGSEEESALVSPDYIIVTSTPTPENIITAAAVALKITEEAEAFGTATPTPENWVTPIVVTPQPQPENSATEVFQAQEATAQAFLFGPATATPLNVWTATPMASPTPAVFSTAGFSATATATPIYILLTGEVATPWVPPTATPTAIPVFIPPELIGKIAFLSNRSGGPEPLNKPLVYIVDPDGGNLAVLTGRAIYDAAIARDSFSKNQRFRVFVKNALNSENKWAPALYFYDYFYKVEAQITHFGRGAAWDPVWSPTREQIAFVSNDSNDDEIWVANYDGSHPMQLTLNNEAYNAQEIGKDSFIPEVNGHPSWSPDGKQLVFWSNRSGKREIWVMNADGSNLYSLSTTAHDDWNPVWIKHTGPAGD